MNSLFLDILGFSNCLQNTRRPCNVYVYQPQYSLLSPSLPPPRPSPSRSYSSANLSFSFLQANGVQVRLTDNPRIGEDYGINIMGEAVEAGASVNPALYGDLHNLGHDLLSQSHDPAKRHNVRGGNWKDRNKMNDRKKNEGIDRWK